MLNLKFKGNGPKLSVADLDGNFLQIAERIQQIDNAIQEIDVRIATLGAVPCVAESKFFIKVDNGKFEFSLPGLNFKGSFSAEEVYNPGDFVFYDKAFWFLSGAPLQSAQLDPAKWSRLFKFPVEVGESGF